MIEFAIGFVLGGLAAIGFMVVTGGLAIQIVEVDNEEKEDSINE